MSIALQTWNPFERTSYDDWNGRLVMCAAAQAYSHLVWKN
jgi:hypothetical protein